MMSLLFHFCYAVISLQIDVEPIIIWLVISGVDGLEDKWGDVVVLEKICGLIIKIAIMEIKKEDLCTEIDIYVGPTEENPFLDPSNPVHISRQHVVG